MFLLIVFSVGDSVYRDNRKLKDITKMNKGQKAAWILLHPK